MKFRILISLFVFWPAIVVLIEIITTPLAEAWGCNYYRNAFEPCFVLSVNIADYLAPYWVIMLHFYLAVLWILPMFAIWIGCEIYVASAGNRKAERNRLNVTSHRPPTDSQS